MSVVIASGVWMSEMRYIVEAQTGQRSTSAWSARLSNYVFLKMPITPEPVSELKIEP